MRFSCRRCGTELRWKRRGRPPSVCRSCAKEVAKEKHKAAYRSKALPAAERLRRKEVRRATREAVRSSPEWRAARDAAFWSLVRKADGDACWEWLGRFNKNPRGGDYPTWNFRGVRYAGHRLAFEIGTGIPTGSTRGRLGAGEETPPAERYVCHSCDNKRCVRPEHLFLGTHQQNMLDAIRKGLRVTLAELANKSGRTVDEIWAWAFSRKGRD